ncbi:MAG: hypothetical protein QOH54_3324 [Mycobacterium sp.]|nr:hypothetical protein [Mycobacterium sp.]
MWAVADGLPVRPIRSFAGQHHYPGLFWSVTTGKHVWYESLLERDRLLLADYDPDVIGIAAQPMWLVGWIGDLRLMLAKNSVGASLIGGLFLASLATKRPLTLIAFQTWRPRDADALARAYHDDVAVRRVFRRAAWVWGVGMILEAALRLPLIYMVPLSVSVGVSAAFSAMVIGSLATWTAVTTARLPRWDVDAAWPDASQLTSTSIP